MNRLAILTDINGEVLNIVDLLKDQCAAKENAVFVEIILI